MDPERAAVWSLVLPGLGHWKLGRRADAVARFVLFGWTFGTLCVLIVSRVGKGGMGPTFALFVLFAPRRRRCTGCRCSTRTASRSGEEPVVGTRMLLWGSAGLVVLSMLIATLVTLPRARTGELDLSTVDKVEDELRRVEGDGAETVVIDLSSGSRSSIRPVSGPSSPPTSAPARRADAWRS